MQGRSTIRSCHSIRKADEKKGLKSRVFQICEFEKKGLNNRSFFLVVEFENFKIRFTIVSTFYVRVVLVVYSNFNY